MSRGTTYGPPEDDGERAELARVLGLSFGFADELVATWFERAGHEQLRVQRTGGRVVGGLIQLPMGQYFGGNRVAMVGYAGVGVAPEARARGVATEMMRAAMRELSEASVPLSALYPASVPLYRRAGFELAGGWYRVAIAARDLPRGEPELASRACEPGDEGAVRRLYRSYARGRNGWLDRSEYIWERTRRDQDGARVHGQVFCSGAEPEGYVFYRLARFGHGFDVAVTDLAASSPRALRAIAGFLGDHRSIGRTVWWHGGADEPLTMLVREHRYEISLRHHFMLRLVSLKAALESRGYPAGLSTTLSLNVHDDVLAENDGRHQLHVEGGRGTVKRGGRGDLSLDVRALAALYSGFCSARQLRLLGHAEGGDAAVDRADALFAGSPPSMADQF